MMLELSEAIPLDDGTEIKIALGTGKVSAVTGTSSAAVAG
jgi:hypothetical protein